MELDLKVTMTSQMVENMCCPEVFMDFNGLYTTVVHTTLHKTDETKQEEQTMKEDTTMMDVPNVIFGR